MHIDYVPQFLSQQNHIPDRIILEILMTLPPSQILARKVSSYIDKTYVIGDMEKDRLFYLRFDRDVDI